MLANAFQNGFVSIFYSCGSNPLSLWDKQVKNGHIRRVVDEDVKSLVLELAGTNVSTTYITCPYKQKMSLGVKLPFLVMIIKNLKKYFTFEIQILDDKDMRRRFRISNFQTVTKIYPFCTTMPICLSKGWNQVQFNLADFTKRAYGSTYLETIRIQIHANVRVRRLYFCDMLYSDKDLPKEYQFFQPPEKTKKGIPKKTSKADKKGKEEKVPPLEKAEAKKEDIPSAAPPTPVGAESPTPVQPPTPEVSEGEDFGFEEEMDEGENVPSFTGEDEEGEASEQPPPESAAKGGEPVEKPADAAAEKPADAAAEKPADAAAEKPADAPADAPAESPAEVPAETPAASPAEAPAEPPAEKPAEAAPEAAAKEKPLEATPAEPPAPPAEAAPTE